MLTTPIEVGPLCLFASTYLFTRVTGGTVQVVSTEGTVHIECDRPRFLLRDLQAGTVAEFSAGIRLGEPPCDYTIESAIVSSRRETPTPGLAVLPDSLPVPQGTLLLETKSTAEYHCYDSLQVAGISKNGRLVIGFASTTYEFTFPPDVTPAQIYRQAVKTDLLADHCTHFTTLPGEAFLNFPPVKRHHCQEISLVAQHSGCWGSLELLDDFRAEPSHAALAKVILAEKAKARGMDI